jgi:hypothetical protein
MGRRFVETDAAFAEEIQKVANSKEPSVMAKVDKLIPSEKKRPILFERLMAAERVVRAERSDLAEAAERE